MSGPWDHPQESHPCHAHPGRPHPRATPPEAAGRTIHSHQLGLLPVVDRLLTRLRLEPFLRDYLPPEDRRARLAPAQP